MSRIYIRNINSFNQPIILNDINVKRKEYLEKLKEDSLKKSYYAWLLLKEMVLEEYNLDIDQLTLYYNEFNKPYFKEFCFNISHSKDLIVVGISNSDIGVDIQYIDKTKDIDKLAKKINSNNDYYDFYKTFSVKEAKSKKIGTGLVLSKLLEEESVNHQEIISLDNDEYVLSISCDDAIIIQK